MLSTRNLVQKVNGFLLESLGMKLVRKPRKTFSFRRKDEPNSMTAVEVRNERDGSSSKITLRSGTSDWPTFEQVFLNEDYDVSFLKRSNELLKLHEELSAAGTPLILDLGANIGLASLYFHHVWPGSRIVAVEPSHDNFALLQENTRDKKAINALLGGVASRSSFLNIVDPSAEKYAFTTSIVDAHTESAVPGITIPDLLSRYPRSQSFLPFMVKIDIEGAEEDLFSSNVDWLSEFPVLVIELHDWLFAGKATSNNFLRAISKLRRDFVYRGENVFSVSNDIAR
jgi:FkbM family methyltransferase